MTLRLRLTALYTLLFGACGALLLGYQLVDRAPPGAPHAAARASTTRRSRASTRSSSSPLAGTLLIAAALGYIVAGRALAPVRARHRSRPAGHAGAHGRADRDARARTTSCASSPTPSTGCSTASPSAFDGQRRFVANASHELRTPLTVIRAEVEVTLADPDATTADLRHMGEAVLEAADRTETLLESLMVLARSQQALPRREPVDLAVARRTPPSSSPPPSAAARSVDVAADLEPRAAHRRPPRCSTASSPTSSRTPCATT